VVSRVGGVFRSSAGGGALGGQVRLLDDPDDLKLGTSINLARRAVI
jgi:hypothetical protein